MVVIDGCFVPFCLHGLSVFAIGPLVSHAPLTIRDFLLHHLYLIGTNNLVSYSLELQTSNNGSVIDSGLYT